MIQVRKRNQLLEDFSINKIFSAISKAASSNNTMMTDDQVMTVCDDIFATIAESKKEVMSVEEIQDVVIKQLIKNNYTDLAILYIRYRERRKIARDSEIDALGLINDYIDESSPEHDMAVHENASTNFSLQGMHQYIFESVIKKKWLSLNGDDIKKASDSGLLHIHDMGYLGCYCGGWDLKQLIEDGFSGVDEKVYCAPPSHFDTALGQAVNFLYTLQGEFAGAQAFSNFNTLMAPFVSHDELTYKQVKREIRSFIYNLNIPTRVGFQSPFTNLTLDMDVTKTKLADDLVIIGGKMIDCSYGSFQKEAQWINQAIVEVMEEGDGKGNPFAYPIITFNVTKDFPWDSKFGETLLKVTARTGSFYFANYINSEFSESNITSMCCRLRIDNEMVRDHISKCSGGLDKEDYEQSHQKGHGFFGAAPNTGSIGVVTLNLPAIMNEAFYDDCHIYEPANLNNSAWIAFKQHIKRYMDLAAESLMMRRKTIEELCEMGLYPYTKHYLRHIKARTGHYFTQHFSTICTNGFHEAMIVYGIDSGMDDSMSWPLAEDLLKFMKEYNVELQKKYNVLFNLEQAPAESAGVKLCSKSGIDPTGNGYYTNSTWFPADSNMDMFDQIKVQSRLNENYTGGSSLHLYTSVDLLPVYKDLKKIITYTFEETKLPYMTISPAFSMCKEHGRHAGIMDKCPVCGGSVITYLRVVGYLRPLKSMNKGRKKEALKRKYFKFNGFQDINNKATNNNIEEEKLDGN